MKRLIVAIVIALLVVASSAMCAGDGSSRRREGEKFPLGAVTKAYREKVKRVTTRHTLKVSTAPDPFPGTQEMYAFLLDYLDLVALVVRKLDIQDYRLQRRTEGGYSGDDGAGVQATLLDLVAKGDGFAVIYAEGYTNAWLIKKLGGKSVFYITFKKRGKPGQMQSAITAYILIENKFFSSLIKIFKPLFKKCAVSKSRALTEATKNFCHALADKPEKVRKIVESSDIMSDNEKKRFRKLLKNFTTGIRREQG